MDDLLDLSVLKELEADIGDAAKEIVKVYIDNANQLFIEIRDAVQTQDHDTVQRLAHSLKSSSANVGAILLSSLAKDVEFAVRDGKLNNLDDKIKDLAEQFEQVKPALVKYSSM